MREQTVVTRQLYPARGRGGGAAVLAITVGGGGHSWPMYKITGKKHKTPNHCRDIEASDVIVKFWRNHAGLK